MSELSKSIGESSWNEYFSTMSLEKHIAFLKGTAKPTETTLNAIDAILAYNAGKNQNID